MNKNIKIVVGLVGVIILGIEIQARWFKSKVSPEPIEQQEKVPKYDLSLNEKFLNTQDLDTVKLLVQNDSVDVNCADSKGNTALHKAAQRGDYKMVYYLIDVAKANPALKNENGMSPRDLAKEEGHEDVVILIDNLHDPHYDRLLAHK